MQFAGNFGFAEIFSSLRALNNPEKLFMLKLKCICNILGVVQTLAWYLSNSSQKITKN